MKNIIFLDVDGVLNSNGSWIGIGDSYNRPIKNQYYTNFSNVSVGLVNELCKEIKADVYIHSSWNNTQQEYIEMFKQYNITFNILPILSNSKHLRREQKISMALNVYNPNNYVIIDDCDLTDIFKDRSIVVDSRIGFSFIDYAKILKLFNITVPIILL